MTLLETGETINPAKTYIVGGWASINEDTKGPAIYDVVSNYIQREKSVKIKENTAVKITGR
jgi:sulfur-oxidizing protein SoxB